jgi:hypothetical protein
MLLAVDGDFFFQAVVGEEDFLFGDQFIRVPNLDSDGGKDVG